MNGVLRNHLKGVPKIVAQSEIQNEALALAAKNMANIAVLKGEPGIDDLVAISYYDSKLVYFFSTVIKHVSWTVMEKMVFNRSTQVKYSMKFLRPNFADKYNQDKDHIDIVDH